MTDAARIAEWIADDFYGRRLDFSKRPASGGGWSELPEVNIVPKGLEDPRRARLFLTFMAAVDKMVDATRLWSAGADLLQAHPGVFDPATASAMDIRDLREILKQGGVVRFPKRQPQAWWRIAVSLSEGVGSVSRLVETGRGDAEDLLRDLRSRDPTGAAQYPELRGRKIGPMWVRMMAEPGGATIDRLEIVPVAVDVQVRRVTENLGFAATAALPLDKAKPRIQKAWFAAVAAASGIAGPVRIRNTCAALDPALWFFGKHGCSHCEQVKRRVPFGRACQACRFPAPGPEEPEKRTNRERREVPEGLGRRFAEPFGTVAWRADGTPFTEEDYERAGMDVPTPEQLKAAGIDFDRQAESATFETRRGAKRAERCNERGAAMEKRHLVDKLLEMRRAGEPRRTAAMTHLFGMIFAEDIRRSGSTPTQIAKDAGNKHWCGYITDGQNLAGYVDVKPECLNRWRP